MYLHSIKQKDNIVDHTLLNLKHMNPQTGEQKEFLKYNIFKDVMSN